MIKANELRIGNETTFGKVYQIEEDCFYTMKDEVSYKSKWAAIEPIPLTPEILEKCGFTGHARTVSFNDSGYYPKFFWYILDGMDEFNQRKFKHGLVIGTYSRDDSFYFQYRDKRTIGTKINFLHQLQNIYFTLTGEELEIAF